MGDLPCANQREEILSAAEGNRELFKHLLRSLRGAKNFQSPDNNSVFVVYAHDPVGSDTPAHARCVIQLIEWLNALGTRVLSDRHPVPQSGARADGEAALNNIFHNQMCLIPDRARQRTEASITGVDKVILCASPLLESYCANPWAKDYMRRLEKIYLKNKHRPRRQLSTALHDFVDHECQHPDFHHVLTEIALLKLRTDQLHEGHGVIPVTMNTNAIPDILAFRPTDLRLRCDPTARDQHRFFFKLLKRVFPADLRIIDIHLDAYLELCVTQDVCDLDLLEIRDRALRLIHDGKERDIEAPWEFSDKTLQRRQTEFLAKLTALPYADRKNRNVPSEPGTCEWAIKHESFIRWANSEEVPLLFLSANPGCGKSVLCRHLVDSALSERTDGTICYFFFKADFVDQRSAIGALRCILHQVFSDQDHLLTSEILDKFDRRRLDLESLTHLWDTLIDATLKKAARDVICIFDALDECDSNDKSFLFDSFANIDAKAKIKFLVTSRPYHDEMMGFENLKQHLYAVIHISGDHGKPGAMLSEEINKVIHTQVFALTRFSSDDRQVIYTELTRNPNRTYLWVKLVMDLVKSLKATTRRSLVEQIRRLPRTVDEAYESLLNKIEEQDEDRARKLLNIVLAAERPLTVIEMAWALQLEDDHWAKKTPEMPREKTFRNDVRTICGLFVTVVAGKIYLLHQTAREFLLEEADSEARIGEADAGDKPADWRVLALRGKSPKKHPRVGGDRIWRWKSRFSILRAHALMAKICMIRISLLDTSPFDPEDLPDADSAQSIDSDIDMDNDTDVDTDYELEKSQDGDSDTHSDADSLQANSASSPPLLSYAEKRWPLHCDAAHGELKLYMHIAYSVCLREVHLGFEHYIDDADMSFYLSTSLMAAAYFNLETVTDYIVSEEPEAAAILDHREDISGFTALHIAVLLAASPVHKTTGVMQCLLQAGINSNAQDNEGRTALHLAVHQTARNAQTVNVIDLLLEYGADPNIVGPRGQGAFKLAANLGLVSVVKLFHQYGFAISDEQDPDGKVMANLISQPASDQALVSRVLHDHAAILEARDSENKTLLHRATISGNPDRVRTLLDLGSDVNALTSSLETPLDLGIRRLYLVSRSQEENDAKLEVVMALWKAGGTTNKIRIKEKTADEVARETGEGQLYAFLHDYETHATWQIAPGKPQAAA